VPPLRTGTEDRPVDVRPGVRVRGIRVAVLGRGRLSPELADAMSLTFWFGLGSWLCFTMALTPRMLRRRMLQPVCRECGGDWWNCDIHKPWRAPLLRGAMFERASGDVAWAVVDAASWPIWVPALAGWKVLKMVGSGLKAFVLRATPLTGPELDRVYREREADIERLTKEIDDGPVVEGDVCRPDPSERGLRLARLTVRGWVESPVWPHRQVED